MKIMIFGQPRSGTTALESQLSEMFGVPGLLEPLDRQDLRRDCINWAQSLPWGIAKILTNHLLSDPRVDLRDIISLAVFDHIILTARKDHTLACLSYYYAEQVVQKYQWEPRDQVIQQRFHCDLSFVKRNFLAELDLFWDINAWLDQQQIRYTKIFYEDYCIDKLPQRFLDQKFKIDDMRHNFKNSEIDYRNICENHQEVTDMIDQHIQQRNITQ
jgi:hypothetical protein